jgi:hypothetical protein
MLQEVWGSVNETQKSREMQEEVAEAGQLGFLAKIVGTQ